jgi:hypothetical protein
MSVQELHVTRQRASAAAGEREHTSRARATTDSAARWSARRILKWGAVGLAIVVGFTVSVFLYLIVMAPEPTSYLG